MGRFRRAVIIIMVVLTSAACPKISVVRISDPAETTTEGVRFYRPYPYLMISEVTDSKSSKTMLQYKIIWLPDISQEYAIQISAGLGTIDFKPTFEEGWKLVGFEAKMDSKTKEIIEAATGLLEKGAKVVTPAKAAIGKLEPGIYRFIYEMQPRLPDGSPNPNYGKIIGVDFSNPVATFQVELEGQTPGKEK